MTRRHHRTVIRREHPIRTPLKRTLFLLFILALVIGAFLYGRLGTDAVVLPYDGRADQLRTRILALETQLEVDAQALNELRAELADSRGSIDELERELAFYREVMAPEELTRGVLLRTPRLRRGAIPGEWRYQLVAQQGGRNRVVHKGELLVTLRGLLNDQPASFALHELDDQLMLPELILSFRYFQRFEGTLRLPPGFNPEVLELQAMMTKPSSDSFENRYAWAELTADSGEWPSADETITTE